MSHLRTALFALSLSLGAFGCSNETPATGADFSNAFVPPVALTQGVGYTDPVDAAPDGNATNVYFVASGGANGAGVFRVPMMGGSVTEVASGAPFVGPRGVAVSSDSSQLAVADPMAQNGGAVFVLPIAGGAPTVLAGTSGTAPQGLEIARINGVDQVFYTGATADTHQPAVFQVALTGGTPVVLAQGAPLVSPSGVAIASNGTVYVSDRGANGTGPVLQITGGRVSTVVNNVRMGTPAGMALTPDDKILGVSSLDANGAAQVFLIDLASGATGTFNQVIRQNQGAGGLHRAHGGTSNLMAWADAQHGGRVYRVELNHQ